MVQAHVIVESIRRPLWVFKVDGRHKCAVCFGADDENVHRFCHICGVVTHSKCRVFVPGAALSLCTDCAEVD